MDRITSNSEFLDKFLEDVRLQGWSNWSIKSCRYTLNEFFRVIDKDCLNVDIDDLKIYLIHLQKKPGQMGREQLSNETIRKNFNNLASFFEFLEFEEYMVRSPIPKFRRRYLKNNMKKGNGMETRQLISVELMRDLINIILSPQDKAIVCTLAKTGVRVSELIAMDVNDIDWIKYSIKLKSTGKRNSQTIYFDNECAICLKRWLDVRSGFTNEEEKALFVNPHSEGRITHTIVAYAVKKHAINLGFHDESSSNLEKRFTPHCCRHWFTTHLRRAGMPREYIKELRGDSRGETIDIYDHIDDEELRRSYLAHIPQLGL